MSYEQIKTETDVIRVLLSYLHLHYVKVSETKEQHHTIAVDPVELTQCIAALTQAQVMRKVRVKPAEVPLKTNPLNY
jgi:hypothetical protein